VDVPAPNLPAGQAVRLPGRGRTWVYDSGVRPGGASVPTLVLLHGWTSTSALNWHRCFATLAREFRVLAVDHRGHGRGIRSWRPFRLEDCADDVAALTERLGTGPVIAVGYSMGGPIAQLLWQRHPDTVQGLVLCATASRFASRRDLNGPVGALGFGMAMALSGVPAPVRQQGFSRLVRNRTADLGLAPWAVAEWERNDPAALVHAGLALGRFDSTEWIGDIDVPTAVVVTTLDATVSPRRQLRMAQSIPGAEWFSVAGDHRACAEQPAEFVPALVAACRSVTRSGADQRAPAPT
jgi:3-oxoadipate enol-lactonase